MADVNYINPTAILPQQGWKPQGFMGGMQYAQQMKDYQDVMSLSQLMSQMGAQKTQEDLTLGAPVRASQRLADIATNTGKANTAIPLADAVLGLKQDEAQISRADVGDKIVGQHAAHLLQMGKNGEEQLNRDIQVAQTIGAVMRANGPAGAAMAAQLAARAGYQPNDPFIQATMQNGEAVTRHLTAVNQKFQEEMAKQAADNKAKREQAESVANIQGATSRATAGIMAQSRMDVAGSKPASAPTTDRLIATYTEQIRQYQAAGQPVPPELIQGLQFLQNQKLAERSAGVQQQQAGGEIFGLDGVPAVPAPTHPAAQPSAAPMDLSKLTPVQKDWIARAKASNPGMSDAQIIEEGKKRGKL